jgi:hypothetical protein
MKKFLILSASFVGVLVVAALLVWWNLPYVGSCLLGRLAGGSVKIERVDFAYKQGVFFVEMGGVHSEGKVVGSAGNLRFAVNLRKGLYFDSFRISDFTLTIPVNTKGKKKRYPIVPTDLLEARNGVVTYGTQTFVVNELVVTHLKKREPFQFRCDVANDGWFSGLTAEGVGFVNRRAVSFKGRASVKRMDLGRLSKAMAGAVDGQASFAYENNRLSVDGSFAASGYELRIRELKEQRFHDTLRGSVSLGADKNGIDVHIKDVIFKGASFRVDVEVKKGEIARVDVSSGFLDVKEFARYVDLDRIEGGAAKVWDYIKGGQVAIGKVRHVPRGRSETDFRVKGIYGAYDTWQVSGVEGNLHIDNARFSVSGLKGTCAGSSFQDASSTYTFSDRHLTARASYSVDLKDVASMVKTDDFALTRGIATGTVSMERKAGRAVDYRGRGSVSEGEALWQTIPLTLRGAYSFTKTGITFEPLRVYRDGTDLIVKGSWSPKQMDLTLKGDLDVAQVNRVVPLPVKTAGIAAVDVGIELKDGTFKAHGSLDMDEVFYEIPNLMTKEKGIANTAHFDVSHEANVFHITRLTYNLGTIDADLKGDIKKNGKMDLDVALTIDGFEKVAPIFAVRGAVAEGDAEAVMSLRDLDLRSKKIPYMKGYVRVNNGFLRIPGLPKPFREIKLKADFTGGAFDIRLNGFKCGESVLTEGSLHVEGLESPRFSLSLAMDNLDFSDFKGRYEFKVSSIKKDGVLARTSGSLAMKAGKARFTSLRGENLEVKGVMADRKVDISEFEVDTLGGHAGLEGGIDFSGPAPKFHVGGKVEDLKSEELVNAFKPDAEIIKGTWLAQGNVSAEGTKPKDWLAGMNGNITLYSSDGVIRRWNLLSKILGLLNVYDLVRGKVDLSADGLPYTTMSASFNAKDGVFRTDNFLIDSPSMLITGTGDIDLKKDEVDGDITVSPLVTIDSIVGKIPIIRSIFRKKKGGFLYVSYGVKGRLGDPEVTVSFVDTIGGKALDIIKNIFTLPAGVFE